MLCLYYNQFDLLIINDSKMIADDFLDGRLFNESANPLNTPFLFLCIYSSRLCNNAGVTLKE